MSAHWSKMHLLYGAQKHSIMYGTSLSFRVILSVALNIPLGYDATK